MDPINSESISTLLNNINSAKPNSKETRDKVRAILRKKFGKFNKVNMMILILLIKGFN
jgi:cell division protein FtsL